jgi:hypothetical protein
MALLKTFALIGLDAALCTAEIRPGQKRVRFRCDQDLGIAASCAGSRTGARSASFFQ